MIINKYKLKDIAKIDISSVDKKSKENEQSIKLCNFMDVYNNWAITNKMYNNFMSATANKNEIERYILKKGMIAITKDSETRDDIGMSTYIADSFDNVILGYHTALIIPNNNIVNSKYLNAYLNSKLARNYFSNSASGSGQRYTLTIDIIGNLPVFLPNMQEQSKIGNILSYSDRVIENNTHINNNLEEFAFTIFLHNFYNKKPNGKIGDIIIEKQKSNIKVGEAKEMKGNYPFFTSGDSILEWNDYAVDGRNLFLNTGGNAGVKFYVGKAMYSTDTWCVSTNNNLSEYLYLYFKSIKNELDRKFFHGSGLKHLQKPLLKQEKIYIPSDKELKEFNEQIQIMFDTIAKNDVENKKLTELKNFLLPLLMNGQINVDNIKI